MGKSRATVAPVAKMTASNSEGCERYLTLFTDSHTGLERDTLGSEEVNTSLNDLLVKLHVGNSIHE
jgi:hypothetical protein